MRSDDPWGPLCLSLSTTSTGGGAELGSFPPPSPLLFLSFLFLQEGSMDLTKVGEKILSSVRSARSLSLLPPSNAVQRPEIPQRAVAAAAVARALAGIPPHQGIHLPSSSAELISIYGSNPSGHITEDLEEEFYEEDFDAARHILENMPPEEDNVAFFEKKVQDLLAEYGLQNVAETLTEGLSRVKRCTDEGRALMSLDLQVLINGLRHLLSTDAKLKMQIVDTFIKAYYLPETEFVHWAHAHPEYSKSQVMGLVNLVATMRSWKRESILEILERIEAGL